MNAKRRIADLEATLRAGLAAQSEGRLEAAASAYGAALSIHPRCADALHLLGQVRHQQGRDAEAADLVRRAIAASPPTAMYVNTLGVVLRQLGRGSEALAAFRRAIAIDPRHASARKNAAVELMRADAAAAEVVQAFVAASALQPGDAECWLGLSQALLRAERPAEAIAAAERSVALDSSAGGAIDAWFAAAHKSDRVAAFVQSMADLAARGIATPEIGLRRIDGLLALERHGEAAAVAAALVVAHPADARCHEKRAVAQQALGDFDDAAASFARALELGGDSEFAAVGLAHCRMSVGRLDEAHALYEGILARHPRSRMAWNNQAVVLCRLDRDAEGVAHFDQALEFDQVSDMTRANRAMSLLRLGRLGEAWDDYRWRESATRPVPDRRWPLDLAGRRIHVKAEQGIGDHLFFLRFVPAIVARGASVTVDADDRLAAMLMRAGFDFAATAPEGSETVGMGHLPWMLGCGDQDMPPPVALPVLPDRRTAVTDLLAGLPRPIVCATWRAGGQKGKTDTTKLVDPGALGVAMRDVPGTVVSVQRAAKADEHRSFADGLGRDVPDLGALNDDLETMLALMADADAYAGVSNANLHLRCGAGAVSDILVTFPIDWRWRIDADGRTPWYPGCAAYRQAIDGDWDEALSRLRAGLASRLG